ncbi:class I SAM-dependent methyltransferase [Methylobrevis albus]|uniref:Class I SAM-dependent methyltransferase n=1 Tax=Methylobrevis albus TaxID=2793297 RepID=A0A931I444_9HYPH|nr:class I SAM-dependent methyltransferase [Methylobrevis albus]MBH0238906.1 class I SAM-dependent methyltransferase [Methylobrevis albus]
MSSPVFARVLDAIERGAFPRTRKWAWRILYNMLSRRWRDDEWRFMNFGFVPEGAPFPLRAEDEPERAFIGLYEQAVAGLPIAGARVLEVGSGRGGGARYIARYHGPASIVGLDYSPETVMRARRLNAETPGLSFEVGDAERMPFADGAFDVVVNIESSHCYADVPAFAREVARVLAPGGWFTFADMRGQASAFTLDQELAAPGLDLVSEQNLSKGVVTALNVVEARKRIRLGNLRLMRRFVTEFSGARGSMLYKGLGDGSVIYVARRYRKAD